MKINKDLIDVALACIATQITSVRNDCSDLIANSLMMEYNSKRNQLDLLFDAKEHLEKLCKEEENVDR